MYQYWSNVIPSSGWPILNRNIFVNKNSYHSTLRFAQNSRINKGSIRIFLYLKTPILMNRRIQSKFRTNQTIIPIRGRGEEKWGKNLWDSLSLKIRDYAEHIMRFIRTSGGMESLIFSRWYHFLTWTRCITNWSINDIGIDRAITIPTSRMKLRKQFIIDNSALNGTENKINRFYVKSTGLVSNFPLIEQRSTIERILPNVSSINPDRCIIPRVRHVSRWCN